MNIYLLISLMLLLPSIIAGGVFSGMKILQKIRSLEYEAKLREQHVNELEHGFAALCKASSGEGTHIERLEQRIRGLSERQDKLDLRSQREMPYSKASQLAHEGASIDELIVACGLSRAEAELVIMLHGSYAQG